MVNKAEIVDELAEKLKTTKVAAGNMYDALMEIVEAHLQKEEDVTLYPIGTFSVTTYKDRKFYDYFSKQNKIIPEMKAVSFTSNHFKAYFKEKLGKKSEPVLAQDQPAAPQ